MRGENLKFDDNKNKDININMVPLLDTIFILLIFFSLLLISVSFMKGIEIKLPFAENTENIEKSLKVISITANKTYYYEDRKYKKDKFWKIIENNKEREFVIEADRNLKFGFIIDIMDRMRSLGIEKIHFELKPE